MRSKQKTTMSMQTMYEVLLILQESIEFDALDMNKNIGLPIPDPSITHLAQLPSVLRGEINYNTAYLQQNVFTLLPILNSKQQVYEMIMRSVELDEGKTFCLSASGGTGKTYIINVILDFLRSSNKIALVTTISGIAATLFHNGRTLHSRFKIPLHIKENSICGFSKRYATGQIMQQAHLLVIDEKTMRHRYLYKMPQPSLQDVRSNNKPFRGLTILFSGDWKQILPDG